MNYNYKKIGQRIRKERKLAKLSQSQFAEKLCLSEKSRQTIGKWENGNVLPSLTDLTLMCQFFNCEIGYLLCEYDCKKKDSTNINEITGLSEDAINVLSQLHHSQISDIIGILNQIITHEDFYKLLTAIYTHVWDFNDNNFRIDNNNVKVVVDCMNCKAAEVKEYLKTSSNSLIENTITKIVSELK